MDDQVSLHAPPQPADDAVPEPQSSQQPAVNTVLRLSDGVCDPLWSNALVQPAAQQCEVLLSVVASLLATIYVSDVEDDTSMVVAAARMRPVSFVNLNMQAVMATTFVGTVRGSRTSSHSALRHV